MAHTFDVVTIGGAVRDITFYTNRGKFIATPDNLTAQRMLAFEYGAKVYVEDAKVGFGGGAANTAVCLRLLGKKVRALCAVGNDAGGHEIIQNLKTHGVDTRLVQTVRGAVSGFSMVLATDRRDIEHIAFVHHGAISQLQVSAAALARQSTQWLYLTSLAGKQWQKNLKSVFAAAARGHSNVIWNPGNVQLQAGKRALSPFLKRTEVLILNKDEAIELVLSGVTLGRKNPRHLNRPVYLLNILQEWGPHIVVITDGKRGAWAYDGEKMYRQAIKRVKAIDTTGVGDAFGATFLAALLSGKTIGDALYWGMVNTASLATAVGAQSGLLTRSELFKKL